jgi:hypothetical protein
VSVPVKTSGKSEAELDASLTNAFAKFAGRVVTAPELRREMERLAPGLTKREYDEAVQRYRGSGTHKVVPTDNLTTIPREDLPHVTRAAAGTLHTFFPQDAAENKRPR